MMKYSFLFLVFFCGLIPAVGPVFGEVINSPPSSSWEREISEVCHKRYVEWCKIHQDLIEKEMKIFSPPAAALSAKVKRRYRGKDFIVFSRPFNKRIMKHSAPSAEAADVRTFRLGCAQNEWEPLYFGVFARKDLKSFSVEMSDLIHANGKDTFVSSPKVVRPYFLYNVYSYIFERAEISPDMDIDPKRKKKGKVRVFKEMPVACMDLPALDVPADTSQGMLIDFHVPEGTVPGEYKGDLLLKIAGNVVEKRPVTLTVYPFVLDDAADWGRGCFISRFVGKQEAVQMVEDGQNLISWWASAYSVKYSGGEIKGDFDKITDYLDMLRSVGMTAQHTFFMSASDPKIQNRIFKFLNRKTITDGRNGRDKSVAESFENSDMSPPFGKLLCDFLRQYDAALKKAGHKVVTCLLDEPDHRPSPAAAKLVSENV
jgi:hypothetical protein